MLLLKAMGCTEIVLEGDWVQMHATLLRFTFETVNQNNHDESTIETQRPIADKAIHSEQ